MRSMTGFGKGEALLPDGGSLSVELSSVNRKQLEIRLALPADMGIFEPQLRKILSGQISRGSVNLRLSYNSSSASGSAVKINSDLFESLAKESMALRVKLGMAPEFDTASLLALPGVLIADDIKTDTPEFESILIQAVESALVNFVAMRESEGGALKADLELRLAHLELLLSKICPFVAAIKGALKSKILERLSSENLHADPNDERVMRELLFYADKADVTEEITRLNSHFVQFRDFLKRAEPVGRSLDFLVQEMFREITTLGNKAGNVEISPLTVDFKSELEKIREQVQNVE